MDQEDVWMMMDRADMRRKEALEQSMKEDWPTTWTCDECGEAPAFLYGDGCYCESHRPREVKREN
jgi:hypothetical protein